jgi:hypothetical protein
VYTTNLLADRSESTGFAAFMNWVGNPADAGIPTNRLMVRVDQYDLVIFVDTVLVHPVRVEDTKITATLADSLLGGAPQTPLELEVVDTLADGLAERGTYSISELRAFTEARNMDEPLGTAFLRFPRRTRTR